MGLPIPQGFTVTTEACNKCYDDSKKIADEVVEQIKDCLAKLEEISSKNLEILKILYYYPFVQVQELLCPV